MSLKIEINIRALAGTSVNGVPIINNREYVGNITLKNEEPGVVAGTALEGGFVELVRISIPEPGSGPELRNRGSRQERE